MVRLMLDLAVARQSGVTPTAAGICSFFLLPEYHALPHKLRDS